MPSDELDFTLDDIIDFSSNDEEEKDFTIDELVDIDIAVPPVAQPAVPYYAQEEDVEIQSTKEGGVSIYDVTSPETDFPRLPSLRDIKVSDTTGDYSIPSDYSELVQAEIPPQVELEVIPETPDSEEGYISKRIFEEVGTSALHERREVIPPSGEEKFRREYLEKVVYKNREDMEKAKDYFIENIGLDMDDTEDRKEIGRMLSANYLDQLEQSSAPMVASFKALDDVFGGYMLYLPEQGVMEPLAFTLLKSSATDSGATAMSIVGFLKNKELVEEAKEIATQQGRDMLDFMAQAYEEFKVDSGGRWTDRDEQEHSLSMSVEFAANLAQKTAAAFGVGGLGQFFITLGVAIPVAIYNQNETSKGTTDAMYLLKEATPEQLNTIRRTAYKLEYINPDGTIKEDLIASEKPLVSGGQVMAGDTTIRDMNLGFKYTGRYGEALLGALKGEVFVKPYYANPVYNMSQSFTGDIKGATFANLAFVPIGVALGRIKPGSLGTMFASVGKTILMDQIINASAGTAQTFLYKFEPWNDMMNNLGQRTQAGAFAAGMTGQLIAGSVGAKTFGKALTKVGTGLVYDGIISLEGKIDPSVPENLATHPILAHLHPEVKWLSDALITLGHKVDEVEGKIDLPEIKRVLSELLEPSLAVDNKTALQMFHDSVGYLSKFNSDILKPDDAVRDIQAALDKNDITPDTLVRGIEDIRMAVSKANVVLLPMDETDTSRNVPRGLQVVLPEDNFALNIVGVHGQKLVFNTTSKFSPSLSDLVSKVVPDIRQRGADGRGALEMLNGVQLNSIPLSPDAYRLWKALNVFGEALDIDRTKISQWTTKIMNARTPEEFAKEANKLEEEIDNILSASAAFQQEESGSRLVANGIYPANKFSASHILSLASAINVALTTFSPMYIGQTFSGAYGVLPILKNFAVCLNGMLDHLSGLGLKEFYGHRFSVGQYGDVEVSKGYVSKSMLELKSSLNSLLVDLTELVKRINPELARQPDDIATVAFNSSLIQLRKISEDVIAATKQFSSRNRLQLEPNSLLMRAFLQYLFDATTDDQQFSLHQKVTGATFAMTASEYLLKRINTGGRFSELEGAGVIIKDIIAGGYGGILKHTLNSADARNKPVGRKFLYNYTVVGNRLRRTAVEGTKEINKFDNVQQMIDYFAPRFNFETLVSKLDPDTKRILLSGYREDLTNATEDEVKRVFTSIADAQRGEPEHAMLRLAEIYGSGVLSNVAEHLGDIINRMTQETLFDDAGYGFVLQKIKKILPALTQKYGFENEVEDNIKSNYRFQTEGKPITMTLDEFRSKIDIALGEYADAFKKLPYYNDIQKLVIDTCIAFGEKNFDLVRTNLITISKHLENEGVWVKLAHERSLSDPIARSSGFVIDLDSFSKLMSNGFASLRKFALDVREQEINRVSQYMFSDSHFDEVAQRQINAIGRLMDESLPMEERTKFVGEILLGFVGNHNNTQSTRVTLSTILSKPQAAYAQLGLIINQLRIHKLPLFLNKVLGVPEDVDLLSGTVETNASLRFLAGVTLADPHAFRAFLYYLNETMKVNKNVNATIFGPAYLKRFNNKKIEVSPELEFSTLAVLEKVFKDEIFYSKVDQVRSWENLTGKERSDLAKKYNLSKEQLQLINNSMSLTDPAMSMARQNIINFISSIYGVQRAMQFTARTMIFPNFDYIAFSNDVYRRAALAYYQGLDFYMDNFPKFLSRHGINKMVVTNMISMWSLPELMKIGSIIYSTDTSFFKEISAMNIPEGVMETDITNAGRIDVMKGIYGVKTKEELRAKLIDDIIKFTVADIFSASASVPYKPDATSAEVIDSIRPMWKHVNVMGFLPQAFAMDKYFNKAYALVNKISNGSVAADVAKLASIYEDLVRVTTMWRGTPEDVNTAVKDNWVDLQKAYYDRTAFRLFPEDPLYNHINKLLTEKSESFKYMPEDVKLSIINDVISSLAPTEAVKSLEEYFGLGLQYYPTKGFAQEQLIGHFPYRSVQIMISMTDYAMNKISKMFNFVLDPELDAAVRQQRIGLFTSALPDMLTVYDFTYGFATSLIKTLLNEISMNGNVLSDIVVHNTMLKTFAHMDQSSYLNKFRISANNLDIITKQHPFMAKVQNEWLKLVESVPIKKVIIPKVFDPFVGMSPALERIQKDYRLRAEMYSSNRISNEQRFWEHSEKNVTQLIGLIRHILGLGEEQGVKELFKFFYWQGLKEGDFEAETKYALDSLGPDNETTGNILIDKTIYSSRSMFKLFSDMEKAGKLDTFLTELFAIGRLNSIISKVDPENFEKSVSSAITTELTKEQKLEKGMQRIEEAFPDIHPMDRFVLQQVIAQDLVGSLISSAMVNPEVMSTFSKLMPSWAVTAMSLRGLMNSLTIFSIGEGLVSAEDVVRNPQYLPVRYYAASLGGLTKYMNNPVFLGRQFFAFRQYVNAYRDKSAMDLKTRVFAAVQAYVKALSEASEEEDFDMVLLEDQFHSDITMAVAKSLTDAPTMVRLIGRMLHEVDGTEHISYDSNGKPVSTVVAGVRQQFNDVEGKKALATGYAEKLAKNLPPFHPETVGRISEKVIGISDKLATLMIDMLNVGSNQKTADLIEERFDALLDEAIAPDRDAWFDLMHDLFTNQTHFMMNTVIRSIYGNLIERYKTMSDLHKSMFDYISYKDIAVERTPVYLTRGTGGATYTPIDIEATRVSLAPFKQRVVFDPTYKEMLFPLSDPFSLIESAVNNTMLAARTMSYMSNLASLTNIIQLVPTDDPHLAEAFRNQYSGNYEIVDLAWFANRGDVGRELFKLVMNSSSFRVELYSRMMEDMETRSTRLTPADADEMQKLLFDQYAQDEVIGNVMNQLADKQSPFGRRFNIAISKGFIDELSNLLGVDLKQGEKELRNTKMNDNLKKTADSFYEVIKQLLSEFRFQFSGAVLTNSNTSWMMNIYGALLLPALSLGPTRWIKYVSRALNTMLAVKKGADTVDAQHYLMFQNLSRITPLANARYTIEPYVYTGAPTKAGLKGAYMLGKGLMYPLTAMNKLAFNVGWKGILNIPGIKELAKAYGFDTSDGYMIQARMRTCYGLVDEVTKFANYLAAREGEFPAPEWAKGGKGITKMVMEGIDDPLMKAKLENMLSNVTARKTLPKMTPEEAMDWIEKFSFTYYELPVAWRAARNIVNPFISFAYNSSRILANIMKYYPVQAIATFAVMNEINRYLEQKHGISVSFKYMIPGFNIYDAVVSGEIPQELDISTWSAPLAKATTLMLFKQEFSPFRRNVQYVPDALPQRVLSTLASTMWVVPPMWDTAIRALVYNTSPAIYEMIQSSWMNTYLPRESYQAKRLVEQGFRGKPIDDFETRINLVTSLMYAITGVNLRLKDKMQLYSRVDKTQQRLYNIENEIYDLSLLKSTDTVDDLYAQRNKLQEQYEQTAIRLAEYLEEAGLPVPSEYMDFKKYSPAEWIDKVMDSTVKLVYSKFGIPLSAFFNIGQEYMEDMADPNKLPFTSIIRRRPGQGEIDFDLKDLID